MPLISVLCQNDHVLLYPCHCQICASYRLALISLFYCGFCCTLYGSSSPFAIIFAILVEAIRGGWYACYGVLVLITCKVPNSPTVSFGMILPLVTLQTILEIVYKRFVHSLGGGKFVKYVGSLPQSLLFVGEGVLTLSVGLDLFNELFSNASVINTSHQNISRLLKDKNLCTSPCYHHN
jgi:hypothetical protein